MMNIGTVVYHKRWSMTHGVIVAHGLSPASVYIRWEGSCCAPSLEYVADLRRVPQS